VKFWNDYGSTFAMAYPVKDAKQGQTFMVFAQIKGIAGDVTTDCPDRNIIPYYKGVQANAARQYRSEFGDSSPSRLVGQGRSTSRTFGRLKVA